MAPRSPHDLWTAVRRARLIRVLAVYFGACFVTLEVVDIFTQQLGLPDWFFPGAVVLLIIGLPIIVTTALVQSAGRSAEEAKHVSRGPESTPAEAPPKSAAEVAAVARHWLTWRKAILGGVLAFALLGVAVTGYMLMRVLGIGPVGSLVAAGVLDEREQIILADFQSRTGDTLLAAAASEAFRIDLAQSPMVRVAERGYVDQILERMEKDPTATIDVALAREVAIREGLKAVIAGEINAAGSGFVLSAELVSAESGQALAAFRETAEDSTAIIRTIDRLSKRLRERIGESLKTIRANEPLHAVTTSSLEALRKYSQAVRAIGSEGDSDKGVALLEEAIALDSSFAMAWRKLGAESSNRGERARAAEAMIKAFELRDRLTDRERYQTIASYYDITTGEHDKSVTALRTLLDTYPDDHWALVYLGRAHMALRDYASAEELFLRAMEVAPYSLYGYVNAVRAQIVLGKFEEAETTLQGYTSNLPGNPGGGSTASLLAAARQDYDAAAALARAVRQEQRGSLWWRAYTSVLLAEFAAVRGRLGEAEEQLRDAIAADEMRGAPGGGLEHAVLLGVFDIWHRGMAGPGLQRVEAALERHPLDAIAPLDRPYAQLVELYAMAEQPEPAGRYLAALEAAIDPRMRRAHEPQLHAARGHIALAEGRPQDAIAEYRLADTGVCLVCILPALGRAYERAEQPDSALVAYERYANGAWAGKIYLDAYELPWVYERLGALYEEKGEAQKAMYYYARLVELWKDADPELQPRVEAARRALEALSSDR